VAGQAILKHMHNLSDEVLYERWLENPYYQLRCGEEFFCHALPFDRSSMTRRVRKQRQRQRGPKVYSSSPMSRPCRQSYDGHTLAKVIPAITQQIGASLTRVIADAGYRGHNAPRTKGLRVYTSGQKRGVTDQIRRELRRRAAVEPVIGHLKEGDRMGGNYLAGRTGDAANTILAAAGYNFKILLAWLARLLCVVLAFTLADNRASAQIAVAV
jgi:hypothetical protein